MALETVPKDLRHLRACLLCSLVKVNREILERKAQASVSANIQPLLLCAASLLCLAHELVKTLK